ADWTNPWSGAPGGRRRVLDRAFVLSSFDNILKTDTAEGFALLDPSWVGTLDVPLEVAYLRILRRYAVRLLASGAEHPWPAGSTPDTIARALAAMVGVVV